MNIYIASDHAGIERKAELIQFLNTQDFSKKYQIVDLGPQTAESVDYPDYADQVCQMLKEKLPSSANSISLTTEPTAFGILICGSGQGMAIRANKHLEIRAALCWNSDVAQLSREHNNANILCLGARTTSLTETQNILRTFLNTPFAGGRHSQRVAKISQPL